MKKSSILIGQIECLWEEIQAKNPGVPDVGFTLLVSYTDRSKKKVRVYDYKEMKFVGVHLDIDLDDVVMNLLECAAHLYAEAKGIQVTSPSRKSYVTQAFEPIAEKFGLITQKNHKTYCVEVVDVRLDIVKHYKSVDIKECINV